MMSVKTSYDVSIARSLGFFPAPRQVSIQRAWLGKCDINVLFCGIHASAFHRELTDKNYACGTTRKFNGSRHDDARAKLCARNYRKNAFEN